MDWSPAFGMPVPVIARESPVSPAGSSTSPSSPRSLLAALPEWLRHALLQIARGVVRGIEIVREVINVLINLVIRHSPLVLSIDPVPVRVYAPTDPARLWEGWKDLKKPLEPRPWPAQSGVINTYPAPAPIEQLEALAETAASATPEDVSGEQAQVVVAEATELLCAIDLTDDTTVLRALRAVETIGSPTLDPLGRMYTSAARVWEEAEWPRTPAGGARKVLGLSIRQMTAALHRGDAARAKMFASLLGAVAPSCVPDAATRLTWFSEKVAVHLHESGVDGAPVRDTVTRFVGRWFGRLRGAPDCRVVDVALACWRPEMAEYTHRAAVDRWARAALRVVSRKNGHEDLFAG